MRLVRVSGCGDLGELDGLVILGVVGWVGQLSGWG